MIHARYAVDPATPWHGVAPLAFARSTGTLAANLETRLGEEAGAAVGAFVPVPQDQGGEDKSEDDRFSELKADIRGAKGRAVVVETVAAGWGEGKDAAPKGDWKQRRFGAEPPAALEALRRAVVGSVWQACGIPSSLLSTDADGTAQREAYRRFALATINPALAALAGELGAKLDTPGVEFSTDGLWAHDGVGRSQMLKNLIEAGIDAGDARAVGAGLGRGAFDQDFEGAALVGERHHGFGMAAFVGFALPVENAGALLVGADHGDNAIPYPDGGAECGESGKEGSGGFNTIDHCCKPARCFFAAKPPANPKRLSLLFKLNLPTASPPFGP